MSEQPRPTDLTRKPVVLELPGMQDVRVDHDIAYARAGDSTLTLDLYRPAGGAPTVGAPVVVFVTGYPDAGAQALFGRRLKEFESYVSWARLAAASGMAAICYANDTPADVESLLRYVRTNAQALGVDARRIAIWSCSGNVPNALSVLAGSPRGAFRCAVLYYGYMLDEEGFDGVGKAAAQWGFAAPRAGLTAADLPRDLPLLVTRAGRDEFAGVNDSIDLFVAAALRSNLPLTLVDHAAGTHAFDILDDSSRTREIIQQTLAFLRANLCA